MKRFLLLLFLVTALTLPMVPDTVPAQDFGLEDGDDIGFVMPDEAEAADAVSHSGENALVLASPARVGEGQPFIVRLTSDQPLDSVSINWQGKQVVPSISVWNNRHVALALLGTDVLTAKPGKEELAVIASIAGKENTFRRMVQIVPEDYPKQELTLPKKMVTPLPRSMTASKQIAYRLPRLKIPFRPSETGGSRLNVRSLAKLPVCTG